MKETNGICILNKETIDIGRTRFMRNVKYRVLFDEDGKGCIVYGEWMSIKDFIKNFVMYVPLLQKRLEMLGLIVNGKPLTRKEFKERCDLHKYGRGRDRLLIYYVGNPKENMFAFYPNQGTEAVSFKEIYGWYVGLVNSGIWNDNVDDTDILWGNCGIPLSYRGLRVNELDLVV